MIARKPKKAAPEKALRGGYLISSWEHQCYLE